ncbi:MAG: phosphogluconate dehydrogenase C-terminal domain-containing protein [Candidatus Latescibacterota bacterium]
MARDGSGVVALIGAGGKMGGRLLGKLGGDDQWSLRLSEKSPQAALRLRQQGLEVVEPEAAVAQADVVVLAVPDRLIGAVSRSLVDHTRPGALVLLLDPAAAVIGEVALRDGLSYAVCHPCHPPLFGEQETPEARRDFFGGVAAWQDLVLALMQGPEEAYQLALRLCRSAMGPVRHVHRITVEQMALLEPAMAEVVGASAAMLMKEAMEEAIRRGVPRPAAESFMLGHVQVPLAIFFGFLDAQVSDAAKIAMRWGATRVLRDDWRRVFEPDEVRAVIREMLAGGAA